MRNDLEYWLERMARHERVLAWTLLIGSYGIGVLTGLILPYLWGR